MSSLCDFPFDSVVVTAPDEAAARAAQGNNKASGAPLHQLAVSLQAQAFANKSIEILSTSDPFGARCGSGGGTLAALDKTTISDNDTTSVLIVHAGGEASRCPTQMALGKAYTTLPTVGKGIIGNNPTQRLVHQLGTLLRGIPKGSVVVAASDTLLSLPADFQLDWDKYNNQDVIGLAVPAPLTTAKNHGVFCLQRHGDQLHHDDEWIQPVTQFLQKPSIEGMQSTPDCAFASDTAKEELAWIDTGVVIFPPKAAMALRNLCRRGPLRACTERGLKQLWQDEQSSTDGISLETFARNNALRVELYTHFLMALQTTTTDVPSSLQEFVATHDDLSPAILTEIHCALSPFHLRVIALTKGQFLHLGTTRELVDFLVHRCDRDASNEKDVDDEKPPASISRQQCRHFGQDLGLVRHYHSFLFATAKTKSISSSSVVINSVMKSTGDLVIGDGSVLEHCNVKATGAIDIGSDCLVSGARGNTTILTVPNSMCFQMLPLQTPENSFVYMYLGINDGIKKGSTFYGMELQNVSDSTGLSEAEFWDKDETNKVLWTAKIHPIVDSGPINGDDMISLQHDELFCWITELQRQARLGSTPCLSAKGLLSLDKWKESTRLPLCEIRQRANALDEWEYRRNLETIALPTAIGKHLENVRDHLLNRRHVECNLDYILENQASALNGTENNDLRLALATLDQVILLSAASSDADIVGRTFMVMSFLLDQLANVVPTSDSEMDSSDCSLDDLCACVSHNEDHVASCKAILDKRNVVLWPLPESKLTSSSLRHCSAALEKAASSFTEWCIVGPTSNLDHGMKRRDAAVPSYNWTVACAPVRIDLSGGWSDTPPVCFEFGGAVCGVAVSVDGMKPLSCRSRIVKDASGILLRCESRDAKMGALTATPIEARLNSVKDMSDYRDPLADCALIKCALVYLGLVPQTNLGGSLEQDLQPYIHKFVGSNDMAGLEIVSTSLLPRGSGLGTSSILAGCILLSIAECVGIDMTGSDEDALIQAVLMLEQLLTTGGGWQDQIGGLVGGFKLGTSKALEFPLRAKVERILPRPQFEQELNNRLVLVFTGHTRLAKNILQNVLRRWARCTREIVDTVTNLVQDAHKAKDAIVAGSVDELADCLERYWEQKKQMAGPDSGVEPDSVREVLAALKNKGDIVAGSLCGAGGGGFMVMLMAKGKSIANVKSTCQLELVDIPGLADYTWHECRVYDQGVKVFQLDGSDDTSIETFDLEWHRGR